MKTKTIIIEMQTLSEFQLLSVLEKPNHNEKERLEYLKNRMACYYINKIYPKKNSSTLISLIIYAGYLVSIGLIIEIFRRIL